VTFDYFPFHFELLTAYNLPLLLPEEKGAGGMSLKSFRRPGVF